MTIIDSQPKSKRSEHNHRTAVRTWILNAVMTWIHKWKKDGSYNCPARHNIDHTQTLAYNKPRYTFIMKDIPIQREYRNWIVPTIKDSTVFKIIIKLHIVKS